MLQSMHQQYILLARFMLHGRRQHMAPRHARHRDVCDQRYGALWEMGHITPQIVGGVRASERVTCVISQRPGPNTALLTSLFLLVLSSNGQVDLAQRAELADELVWWSRLVIPLASLCLQCTQPLTFTCGLPDRRLFHLHRVRSTVKAIRASLIQIRIAPRA